MLDCQRHLFGLPDDLHYLNTAYMGPQLREASRAGTAALLAKEDPTSISGADFFDPVEHIKAAFAKTINAPDPKSIAIVPSVSYGLQCVANNAGLSAGQQIVTVGDVFPSGRYAFESVAQAVGATVVDVPRPADELSRVTIWNEQLLAAIDERTRVVFVPHVHWSCGTVFDLVAVREKCTLVDALLVVDGTQSVGAHPFDVAEFRPDALVVGGYKWLLGAYGFGYLYLAEHLHDGKPLEENWINRRDSHDFARLTVYTNEYREGAARYSMGEQSSFIAVAVAAATFKQLNEWTSPAIKSYADGLVEAHRDELADLGWVLPKGAQLAPHLFGLRLSSKQKQSIPPVLAAAKVNVSYRGDFLRVSTHVTTRTKDWRALMEGLRQAA